MCLVVCGSLTGWVLIVANLVSAATITVGFVAYLSIFVDTNHWVATTLVVVAVAGVANATVSSTVLVPEDETTSAGAKMSDTF